jgi:EmrB/QacA subfamily drug resistance transporter
MTARRRTLILWVLSLSVLMIVLDTTVVTVALPSIGSELNISGAPLTWMLNAYMLAYGGGLLLGGRIGDLYGHKRVLLFGIAVFTAASGVCGLTTTSVVLIATRAIQGLGGAAVTTVTLSLVMILFKDSSARAKAIAILGSVCAGGGAAGELVGGVLTNALGWHWVFLINVPIGVFVGVCCLRLLPSYIRDTDRRSLDIVSAVTLTGALTLFLYAVVNGNESGWMSVQTLSLLAASMGLLILFARSAVRGQQHLIPSDLFRARNFAIGSLMNALLTAGMLSWSVVIAMYLKYVRGYEPYEVGLAFVPAELAMVVLSLGGSARIVAKIGVRASLSTGLVVVTAGLILCACVPSEGAFGTSVLPGMILLGLGSGLATTPLLLAALQDIQEKDSGSASGIVNTSGILGGSVGLAVLLSLADVRSGELQQSGASVVTALVGGYRFAFMGAALLTFAAGALAILNLRETTSRPACPPHARA